MELIERYLQEIGRQLPRENRADILSELRSSLMDTLEDRFEGEPGEQAIVQVIKEMGSPQDVAASYHPKGQYLIGPELYPTFKLVLGIVLTSVIGAQLLAIVFAISLSQKSFDILDTFGGIISSLLPALGMVVIVFAILQRYGVQTEINPIEFDPRKLPQLERERPVKRVEQVFGIVLGVVVLAILSQFALSGGFARESVFANPVIDQYFPWIAISMIFSIVIDIFLLWKGRWQTTTRILKISANIFSLVILGVLIQGHNAWLANMGVNGLFDFSKASELATNYDLTAQIVGMSGVRIALTVAFIVTAVETFVQFFRMIWINKSVIIVKQVGTASIMR